MSVQKLVAEADKLLEKGKFPEAITKLKSALAEEPLNQIVATKLANVCVQNHEPAEAAKIYGQLAKRLSDAGKSQVATAIYKQALELTPEDINLRVRFAQECESVGKLGDAFLQAQIALDYFLKRKKYFDAANLMPLLARSQPKDEKIKQAWIEVLLLSQAEQKLVHFLVAISGPPGIVSQEFPVGGEPAAVSQALYDGLKKLVPFFPRDPRVAYTMAWTAYRKGHLKEFYHFLRESLRRDPDFSLSILLLARVLSESQKMNEAMFAYRCFKERMAMDKTVDMLTLNRLLETFVEKNGWIKFTEEMGDALDAAGFLKAITGAESTVAKIEAEEEKEKKEKVAAKNKAEGHLEHAPAEIELGISAGDPSADQGMEIVLATGQTVADANKQQKVSDKEKDPLSMQAQLIKAAIEATVAGMGGGQGSHQTVVQPVVLPVIQSAPVNAMQVSSEIIAQAQAAAVASATTAAQPQEKVPEEGTGEINFKGESVEFTSLINLGAAEKNSLNVSDSVTVAPAADVTVNAEDIDDPVEQPEPKKKLFNPMDQMSITESTDSLSMASKEEERTQIFSPIDVLDAAKVMKNHDLSDVDTKSFEIPKEILEVKENSNASGDLAEGDKEKWKNLKIEGEHTLAFSPVEAVQAGVDSRRPMDAPVLSGMADWKKEAAQASPEARAEAEAAASSDATMVFSPIVATESSPATNLASDSDATRVMVRSKEIESEVVEKSGALQVPAAAAPAIDVPKPQAAIVLIPEVADKDDVLFGATEEQVDLGDDLLEGATRVLTQPTAADKTEHLIKEIKKEMKQKANAYLNIEMLMKKAERYTAKRNYYLARKALRHAKAIGADEEAIKLKLREIRKLEFPESLYNTASSDQVEKVDTSELLDCLEQEFDLSQNEESSSGALIGLVEARIEAIFSESDPRTILDFGVALQEMGLFRQAEALLMRLVSDFPEYAFDAYYLAAMSKLSRRDYAGAASILKRLSNNTAKTEIEKIQIYYALGETFDKMRQPKRSRKFFEKVAELDANYRNIRHKLEE